MKVSENRTLIGTLFLFNFLLPCTVAIHLQLSKNYLLNYECSDGRISFDIQAINVSGWVGLGFNKKSADISEADFLIGGMYLVDFWPVMYGGDFNFPLTAEYTEPSRDKSQDYLEFDASDPFLGQATYVTATRHLTTGDDEEDVEIKDEPIYLLWAYHEWSDDYRLMYTHNGSVLVNLFTDTDCEGWTGSTESSTEASEPGTDTLPTTTESTPSLCPPTGTDLVEHPTSCTLYFICVEGTAYEQECGDGLHFNPVSKECDFPENVNCIKPLPECPAEGVSLQPYPGNCSLYVVRAEGTPSVWTCAERTCFDPTELANGTTTLATLTRTQIGLGSV